MLTFSRSGTATYFDSNGDLQTAADGDARVGSYYYDGSSWVNGGLRFETEARTNLATGNDDLATFFVTQTRCSVSNSGSASPLGTAARCTDDNSGSNTTAAARFSVTVSASADHVFSVYLKNNSGSQWVSLDMAALGLSGEKVWFDLDNGTVGTAETGLEGQIENAGDGWWRCGAKFTTNTDTIGVLGIYFADADNDSIYVHDGRSFDFIGVQVEEGSEASSYIPTAGSTATRSAETLSIANAKLPSMAGQELTIHLDLLFNYFDEDTTGQFYPFRMGNGFTEGVSIRFSTGSTATGRPDLMSNNGTDGYVTLLPTQEITPGANKALNWCATVTASAVSLAIDGTSETPEVATAFPAMSAKDMNFFQMNGHIRMLRVWGDDIEDAGREAATA